MNSKGFTIIELLATIIILATIMLIAVPSVNGVSNAVRKNSRNNLISKIEINAEKYAFDTGKTLIFVDELVKEGYLTSDNDGNIKDPVNNGRLNCYLIEMEKVNDYYNAKFKDNENYEVEGVCDTTKLNELNEDISIVVLNDGSRVDNINGWLTGKKIVLRVYSNSVIIDCVNNHCNWASSNGYNKSGVDEIEIDVNNINSLLESKYTFQMTKYIDNDNKVKRYTSSVNLKIDNEAPTIYKNEIKISDAFNYTDSKTVTIEASDGKGSGIQGYYLGVFDGKYCNSSEINYLEDKKIEVKENGNYLVCVKDKVGNISSSIIKIEYIN